MDEINNSTWIDHWNVSSNCFLLSMAKFLLAHLLLLHIPQMDIIEIQSQWRLGKGRQSRLWILLWTLTGQWYLVFRSNLYYLVYYAFHYRALHTMYILYYWSPAHMTVVIRLSTLFLPMTNSLITDKIQTFIRQTSTYVILTWSRHWRAFWTFKLS